MARLPAARARAPDLPRRGAAQTRFVMPTTHFGTSDAGARVQSTHRVTGSGHTVHRHSAVEPHPRVVVVVVVAAAVVVIRIVHLLRAAAGLVVVVDTGRARHHQTQSR